MTRLKAPKLKPAKQLLIDAVITFRTADGREVAFDWDAQDGNVSCGGVLVHNTNDIGTLHTIAKGILAVQKP